MLTSEIVQKINALKGAPASILLALVFSERPLGRDELVIATGYGRDSVTAGIKKIKAMGSISPKQFHDGSRRRSGYILSPVFTRDMLPGFQKMYYEEQLENKKAELSPLNNSETTEKPEILPKLTELDENIASISESSKLKEEEEVDLFLKTELTTSPTYKNKGEKTALENKEQKTEQMDLDHIWDLIINADILFGEPISGKPVDYEYRFDDLLAWIAQVYDNRHKFNTPARIVFCNVHPKKVPEPLRTQQKYRVDPWSFLPNEYKEVCGMQYLVELCQNGCNRRVTECTCPPPEEVEYVQLMPDFTTLEINADGITHLKSFGLAIKKLDKKYNKAEMDTWLCCLELIKVNDGIGYVTAQNAYGLNWVRERMIEIDIAVEMKIRKVVFSLRTVKK